jgi:hypothetical protein
MRSVRTCPLHSLTITITSVGFKLETVSALAVCEGFHIRITIEDKLLYMKIYASLLASLTTTMYMVIVEGNNRTRVVF